MYLIFIVHNVNKENVMSFLFNCCNYLLTLSDRIRIRKELMVLLKNTEERYQIRYRDPRDCAIHVLQSFKFHQYDNPVNPDLQWIHDQESQKIQQKLAEAIFSEK